MKRFLFYAFVFLVPVLISGQMGLPSSGCGCPPMEKYIDRKVSEALNIPPGFGEVKMDCEDCLRLSSVALREVHVNIDTVYNNDVYIQEYLRHYNLDPDQRRIVEDCLRSKNKGYLKQEQ